MIKKFYILFKIARKLALSDAIKIISKIHKPPLIIKILVSIFSIKLSQDDYNLKNLSDEEKLCKAIEGMGTTFIKLGQFLATRPDIISEKLSKQLEKLQDRVPPFSSIDAKNILKDELGDDMYKLILNLSEPIAAASIAQVHKAQINENGTIKDIAIKILRPDIKKKFNLKKGSEEQPMIGRFALHAHELNFQDITGETLEIIADYPKDFNVFLSQLKKFDSINY